MNLWENLQRPNYDVQKNDSKIIMGGSGAIANNLIQFCDDVKLVSY